MITGRNPFEINDTNATIEGSVLTITVPGDQLSQSAVDFYFNPDFIKDKSIIATSAKVESGEALNCFWNWLLTAGGTPDYIERDELGTDLAMVIAPSPGKFGFSGYTESGSDVKVVIQLKD